MLSSALPCCTKNLKNTPSTFPDSMSSAPSGGEIPPLRKILEFLITGRYDSRTSCGVARFFPVSSVPSHYEDDLNGTFESSSSYSISPASLYQHKVTYESWSSSPKAACYIPEALDTDMVVDSDAHPSSPQGLTLSETFGPKTSFTTLRTSSPNRARFSILPSHRSVRKLEVQVGHWWPAAFAQLEAGV
jgi:hypothetical protein